MHYCTTIYRSLATSFVALLVTITTTVATAAEPVPTEADREQARGLLDEGLRAIRAGEYDVAQQALSRALELLPTYDIAISLGQAELKLGRYVDAARHFQFALNQFPPSESRKLKQSVVEHFEQAQQHIATLLITTIPQGANILIDGKPVEQNAGSPLFVEPGERVLEARLDSDAAEPQTIRVGAGEKHEITLELKPQASAAPTPLHDEGLATPPHGGESSETSKNSESSKSLVPVYVGVGITAVGLGTWMGFGLAAGNAKKDAREFRDSLGADGCSTQDSSAIECRQARDALDRQRRNAKLSRVGLGVTVVGGIATLAYLFLWPDDAEAPLAGVLPHLVIGRHESIVEVSGEF
jgi:tetratricopeptide (TPR) repeat protein